MTRQIRPALRVPLPPGAPEPERTNQGWGKLAGAMVLGVAGALTLQLAGAITGMVLGAALGHWLDQRSKPDDPTAPLPPTTDDLVHEANLLLAGEVAEAFNAVERASNRKTDRAFLSHFLSEQLQVQQLPTQGPEIPWQADLASACGRVAERLDEAQKSALVLALYRHAQALQLGPGPARLILRDGVAALGLTPTEEDELREKAGML